MLGMCVYVYTERILGVCEYTEKLTLISIK